MAEEALEALLDEARLAQASKPVEKQPEVGTPTVGDAIDACLAYLQVEKRRKHSTLRDARNAANACLVPRFGRETPLTSIERDELVVRRNGRQFLEVREERRDRFTAGVARVGALAADGPEDPRVQRARAGRVRGGLSRRGLSSTR